MPKGLLTRNKKLNTTYNRYSVPTHAAVSEHETFCGITTNETYWTFQDKPQEHVDIFVNCHKCCKKLDA